MIIVRKILRLSRPLLCVGSLLVGALLSSPALSSPRGISDGTIPIALHAEDGAIAGESAVTAMNLADHISRDGMLDDGVLDAKADGQSRCLAEDIQAPGSFSLNGMKVAIKTLCQNEAGVWTISGKERVSGDSYLITGSLSAASDGTIAFIGDAFKQVSASKQALGSFKLQAKPQN